MFVSAAHRAPPGLGPFRPLGAHVPETSLATQSPKGAFDPRTYFDPDADADVASTTSSDGSNLTGVMSDLVAADLAGSDAELLSVGSANHTLGTCKPCHYVHTKAGCASGNKCTYCHYRHQKRNNTRIPRDTRYRLLSLVQAVHDRADNPTAQAQADAVLQAFLAENPSLSVYAAAVGRSLRRGAVLQGIKISL